MDKGAEKSPEQSAGTADADRRDNRTELNVRFNARVSYVCKFVALIIGIVVVATAVLGQLDYDFAILGLATGLVLLALASLQQHHDNSNR